MLDASAASKAVGEPSGSASRLAESADKLLAGAAKLSANRPATMLYATVVGAPGVLSPAVATTRAAAKAASTSAQAPNVKQSSPVTSGSKLSKEQRMARFAAATTAARAPIPKHVQAPTLSDVSNVEETGEKGRKTILSLKDARLFRRTDKLEKRMDMWLEKAQLTLSAGSQAVTCPKKDAANPVTNKQGARKAQGLQQASMVKPLKVAGRTENPRLTKAKAKFMQRLQKAREISKEASTMAANYDKTYVD